MGAVRKVLLLSCLAVLSAAEIERPVSKLEAMLESIGLEGVYEWGEEMASWAWSVFSDLGSPVKEMSMEKKAAVLEHPSQRMEGSQVDTGFRGDHGGAWKMLKDMHSCHAQCGEDKACHEKCPKPWSHAGGHGGHGGRWKMWMKIRTCHEKCEKDEDCHKKCPKPWEMMEKKCEEFKGIKTCHKSCGHDFECHKKCPMPSCQHAAEKTQEAMDCHGQCVAVKGGRDCHLACPKPMKHLEGKCQRFETAHICHQACKREDHECHRACWHRPHGDDEEDAEDHEGHHRHHAFPGFWHHLMKKIQGEAPGDPSSHRHPWFAHHEGKDHHWPHPWQKRWESHKQSPESVSTTSKDKPDLHV